VGDPCPGPPALLQLAGHPLRWALLRELARSDRQVQELAGLLGQQQSLVSYHPAGNGIELFQPAS
jgi:hypothetical protein